MSVPQEVLWPSTYTEGGHELVWTFSISPKYCLSHRRFCDPVLILRVVMSLDELFLLGLKWICFSKIVSHREKDLQMYQSKFIWSITLKKIHIFMNFRENMRMMSPQITCLLKKLFLTLITIYSTCPSPHDEHQSSGPRPVKFSVFYLEIHNNNSRIWFGPVNLNFHFEDCLPLLRLNVLFF